jgi:hypothetical protein
MLLVNVEGEMLDLHQILAMNNVYRNIMAMVLLEHPNKQITITHEEFSKRIGEAFPETDGNYTIDVECNRESMKLTLKPHFIPEVQ